MPHSAAATTPRPVDVRAVQRAAVRVAAAPSAPWLHGEVARRMAARIELLKRKPRRAAVWWPHPAEDLSLLEQACLGASCLRVTPEAIPARRAVGRRWTLGRLLGKPAEEMAQAEVVPQSVDLVWANMMLHGVIDPLELIAQWHRALQPDGCLMFSTLGPGSLPELRQLYAEEGWGPPMAPLVDMHDLGDMLVGGGFADPVMDQERVVLTWDDAAAALAELRSLGGNADPARHSGLRTPRWKRQLARALDERASQRADGRVALTFELAYGHAWRGSPRVRGAGDVRIPVEDLLASAPSRRVSTRGSG